MTARPYARLALTEAEFTTVRGCVTAQRQVVFERWRDATDPQAQEFYRVRLDRLDALLEERFEPVLVADTSQDAEPDDDD